MRRTRIRVKTPDRVQSTRRQNTQSSRQVQSVAKPAAPPGSLAATNANKAHAAPAASAPHPPAAGNPSQIGWNVNNGQKPVGPPPAYPGMGNNYAHPGGAPPAYSPYAQRQPGQFQQGHNPGGYPQQQQSYNPYMQHGMGGPPGMGGGYGGGMPGYGGGYGGQNYGMMGGGMGMGGMGMGGMGMGGGGMMMMGYPQKKSSMFSLSNVLTGVALYSMYRSLTGGGMGGMGGYGQGYNNYGPREVHIYDHREHKPSDPNDLKPIMGTLGLPQSVTGEKIEMSPKTMEEIVEQTPVQNVTTVNGTITTPVEDPLPPLPFDNQPKIYFGYGYAYGYQNATMNLVSAVDGRLMTTQALPSTMTSVIVDGEMVMSTTMSDLSETPEDSNISKMAITGSDSTAQSSSTTMKSQVE